MSKAPPSQKPWGVISPPTYRHTAWQQLTWFDCLVQTQEWFHHPPPPPAGLFLHCTFWVQTVICLHHQCEYKQKEQMLNGPNSDVKTESSSVEAKGRRGFCCLWSVTNQASKTVFHSQTWNCRSGIGVWDTFVSSQLLLHSGNEPTNILELDKVNTVVNKDYCVYIIVTMEI